MDDHFGFVSFEVKVFENFHLKSSIEWKSNKLEHVACISSAWIQASTNLFHK